MIVDADPAEARNLLLRANACFKVTQANKLVFVGKAMLQASSSAPLHEVTHGELSGRIDDDKPS